MSNTTVEDFVPTQARGAALAREILTQIQDEVRLAARSRKSHTRPTHTRNAWNQGVWAQLHLADFCRDVRFKVTKARQKKYSSSCDTAKSETVQRVIAPVGLSCGSAMCFAGHVDAAVGDQFIVAEDRLAYAPKLDAEVDPATLAQSLTGLTVMVEEVITTTGRRAQIGQRARQLLGLTGNEASTLFSAQNTLEDLTRYVEAMERGENIYTGRSKRAR